MSASGQEPNISIPVAFLPSTPLCITAQAAKILVIQPVESDSPTPNMEGCYGEEGKEGESGQKNETPEEEVEFQGCAAPWRPWRKLGPLAVNDLIFPSLQRFRQPTLLCRHGHQQRAAEQAFRRDPRKHLLTLAALGET